MTDQRHLDFGAPNFAPETYVNGLQNGRARAALETWRTWPGGVFCIFGETGFGKSHLGTVWAQKAKAPILRGADFNLEKLASLTVMGAPLAFVDDGDQCDETALFALLTTLESGGGAVLLTGKTPPKQWDFVLPDIKSRLSAVASEGLASPEPEFLAQLIIRFSAARGFKIDDAASAYLANRIPRTFAATHAIVACMEDVTRTSLKSPKALAQRALQAFYQSDDQIDDNANPDLFDPY